MKTIRSVIRLLARNFWTLLGFEALLRLLTTLALVPVVQFFIDNLMAFYGYSFITLESLPIFLSHPGVIVAIMLLLLVLSAISIFDVSAVLLIFDQSREDKDITMREALSFGLKQAARTFYPRNILLPLYALLLVPLLNLGITSNIINSIPIPEFIMDYILENQAYTALYALVGLVLGYMFIRLIYTFPSFLLEGKSFVKSVKRSVSLTRKHFWGDLVSIVGLKLLFDGVLIVIVIIPSIIAMLVFLSSASTFIKSIVIGIVAATAVAIMLLTFILGSATSYAIVCARYWNRLTTLEEEIPNPEPPKWISRPTSPTNRWIIGIAAASYVVLCVSATSYAQYSITNKNEKIDTPAPQVEVTAHRGASKHYPENTMAAFRGAKLQGADWVELDVQQSKDGVLFIAHDSNFIRISGVNKNAWEMDYSEIAKLDASGLLNKQYKGERYPTLKQVLAWAKTNNMRLNVELKPNKHYFNLEAQTAQEIRDAGMTKNVIVTSQNYDCVKNIARVAPDMSRVYVMSLVYGKIDELDAANIYSVEENSCTERFVRYAHENGKQVLAWTINRPANMERVLENGVDNIITDDVPTAKRVIASNSSEITVDSLINDMYYYMLGM
ncbi:MAG: glycerophosphoryl diester phosphodiesterase membrane domain-containing protein [Atopobium sp.]|uniref:glycerophosphodiester phosphodiesterase family protein n=1 Tax=Atopobium sp. TaxID=1872650 RepID=UPI002A83410F|nr:glycerophosphodiester phosphodiesterase family protein [Atopobium sp.]MDY4522431.1 glycerophosphoryl diester phosphodiesterase membrane domain-containing protein [Atopobium sp.]